MIDSKIIVALDYADSTSALNLVNQLDPGLCKLKIGKELFTVLKVKKYFSFILVHNAMALKQKAK